MKAITVCQPYAELIVLPEKPIENRKWYTGYRGLLFIHAGKSREWLEPEDEERYPGMVFGALVGAAQLVACLDIDKPWPEKYAHLKDHPHTLGPFCLVLEDAKRLPAPIECRGALGLWELPRHVEMIIEAQQRGVLV